MIQVYYWAAQKAGPNVGHASAMVGTTYVSWWPTGDWSRQLPGAAQPNLQADVRAEGKQPDRTWKLTGLAEQAGVAWWNGFTAGAAATYYAYGQNCSWAVIKTLKAAGADAHTTFGTRQNVPGGVFCGWRISQTVRRVSGFGGTPTGRELVDNTDECTTVWTPKDVERYCDELQLALAMQLARPGAALPRPRP